MYLQNDNTQVIPTIWKKKGNGTKNEPTNQTKNIPKLCAPWWTVHNVAGTTPKNLFQQLTASEGSATSKFSEFFALFPFCKPGTGAVSNLENIVNQHFKTTMSIGLLKATWIENVWWSLCEDLPYSLSKVCDLHAWKTKPQEEG